MDQNNKPKQYGLFKFSKTTPATSKSKTLSKPAIFGDDSDSDSEQQIPQYQSSNLKKQTQKKIDQAVDLDPTIFQYDEVYDQIKKPEKLQPTKIENKPRYISNLLKAAEVRKKEQEIRFERKIQKEREKEGEEFKDKESFVTSAYREKLEEMRKTHEEMEKQEKIDEMLDVTKQGDLNGFYRSLYKNDLFNEDDDKQKKSEEKIVFNKSSVRKKIKLRERDNLEETEQTQEENDDNSESKILPMETETITLEKPKEKNTTEKLVEEKKKPDSKNEMNFDQKSEKEPETESKKEEEKPPETPKSPVKKLTREEIILKLFEKRTVGPVFEEARKRYLERKALREQAKLVSTSS